MIKLKDLINEDLRAWFGKGGKGGVGGGGWDRYNSSGDRVGKCGDAKEGDAYAACLSKEKARKLGKAGRAAFVKRKRAAQKKGGDAKKGGERSKGQKPIKVKTGVKESISVNTAYDKIDRLPQGKIFNDAKRIDGIFNKSKHSYSEVIEAFEKNKAKNNIEFVSVKDVHITQPNIQSNKVKQTITSFDDTATINVVQFPDGEMAIYDGHHRLTAAWAIGKDKIKVNLVKTGIKKEIALREYTPSNPADIDKAIRDIEKLGVRNPINPKEIVIDDSVVIEVQNWDKRLWFSSLYSIEKGKGNASRIMKKITDIADKYKVTIALDPHPFSSDSGKLNRSQLVNFYKKFGFNFEDGEEDFGDMERISEILANKKLQNKPGK